MDLNVYQVGKVNESLIGNEKLVFDYNDSGGVLFVLFADPTKEEIEQFQKDMEIRYVKVGSTFMLLFKFGSLNWMDAPYSPHLSKLTKIEDPADGAGIGINIIFGDCITGCVHAIRLVGLTTEFSRQFISDIREDLSKPFDNDMYGIDLVTIMDKYSTEDLVSMADVSCTIRRN